MQAAARGRVRHVWVLSSYQAPARPGLVATWRKVPQRTGQPLWQALVIHVDDRHGTVQAEWVYAMYLVPIPSAPPAL